MDYFQKQLDTSLENQKEFLKNFYTLSEEIVEDAGNELVSKFQKTSRFLTKFQNDIEGLNNTKLRDSESIYKIKKQIENRKSRSQLLRMAFQMQKGLVYQLRESLSNFQKTEKMAEEQILKSSWGINQTQVKLETLKRQFGNPQKPHQISEIQIDKESNRIILTVSTQLNQKSLQVLPIRSRQKIQGGAYEVLYLKNEDKFITHNRIIAGPVMEFNFHRNIKKLYHEVVFSHIDSFMQ